MTPGLRLATVRVGLLCLLLAGVLTFRLFVWPPTPRIDGPDAIVVLSGGHGERLREALALSNRHPDAALVISNGRRPGWPAANALCEGTVPVTACFRPDPQSTAGEARAVGRLARDGNWQQVAVVTSTYHATRAAVLMRQCLPGGVVVVVPAGYGHVTIAEGARAVLREVVSTAAALTVRRAC